MRPLRHLTVIIFVLLSGMTPALQTQQDVRSLSQARLAESITTGSLPVKIAAIDYILTIPPQKREPALEDGLVVELKRLNEETRQRFLQLRAGTPYEMDTTERSGEYRLDVIQAVTQSSDPKVIPALIGALGAGTGVSKALAKFGDRAVEPLSVVARQDQPDDNAVTDALHALRYVLDAGTPISSRSRDLTLITTVERLTGRQSFLHVIASIQLAVATKDVALRRRVEQLANDPEQVRQLGVSDTQAAAKVRNAALAALRKG